MLVSLTAFSSSNCRWSTRSRNFVRSTYLNTLTVVKRERERKRGRQMKKEEGKIHQYISSVWMNKSDLAYMNMTLSMKLHYISFYSLSWRRRILKIRVPAILWQWMQPLFSRKPHVFLVTRSEAYERHWLYIILYVTSNLKKEANLAKSAKNLNYIF